MKWAETQMNIKLVWHVCVMKAADRNQVIEPYGDLLYNLFVHT